MYDERVRCTRCNVPFKSSKNDKLSFIAVARERPSLPLWGRWQPEGLTEEGRTTLIYRYGSANANLSRPRWRSATLPKGEGLRLRRFVR